MPGPGCHNTSPTTLSVHAASSNAPSATPGSRNARTGSLAMSAIPASICTHDDVHASGGLDCSSLRGRHTPAWISSCRNPRSTAPSTASKRDLRIGHGSAEYSCRSTVTNSAARRRSTASHASPVRRCLGLSTEGRLTKICTVNLRVSGAVRTSWGERTCLHAGARRTSSGMPEAPSNLASLMSAPAKRAPSSFAFRKSALVSVAFLEHGLHKGRRVERGADGSHFTQRCTGQVCAVEICAGKVERTREGSASEEYRGPKRRGPTCFDVGISCPGTEVRVRELTVLKIGARE